MCPLLRVLMLPPFPLIWERPWIPTTNWPLWAFVTVSCSKVMSRCWLELSTGKACNDCHRSSHLASLISFTEPVMSGLTLGYTGSYIFSQTIFTYRTGIHSKWIGFLIMIVFFYIVVSEINMLQIAPLFFLGSTLIFIGYDLLFEWLWEIRHQVCPFFAF